MELKVYQHCKRSNDNNHLLLELQKYMITKDKYNMFNNIEESYQKKEEKKKVIDKLNKIYPQYQDKLFWCFFIVKYGELEYNTIGQHSFSKEKEIKIANIETMKKNSSLLKLNKLKKAATECDLLNSKKINLSTFYALCLYNDINVVYLSNKCYYEFFSNCDGKISLVQVENKKICCELELSEKALETIRDKNYKIENISKPIKAISNYKLTDLKEICKIFSVKTTYDSGKNKTKKDLYEEIQKFMQKID